MLAAPTHLNCFLGFSSPSPSKGIGADVDFAEADPEVHDQIDATYHAKYDRWGPGPVGHVTGPSARDVTILLVLQDRTTQQHQEDS